MRRLVVAVTLALFANAGVVHAQAASDPAEDPHNLTWIDQGVFALGGGGLTHDDLAYLKSQGFGAVADFRSEWDDGQGNVNAMGMDYLYLPIDHAMDTNLDQVDRFIAWADAEVSQHKTIYIHCTDGHHRAAIFAVAWMMHHDHKSYDEASTWLIQQRTGTEMRGPGALLQYQAEIQNDPALSVFLTSTQDAPPSGGSIPVIVEVYAHGQPAQGANVHLFTPEGRVDQQSTTDSSGKAAFTYTAPTDGTFMDHLYARASLQGYADGADAVEVYYGIHVSGMGTLGASAWNDASAIHVQLTKTRGEFHARILESDPTGWTHWTTSTTSDVTLPLPPSAGVVTIRVAGWSATDATTTVNAAASSDQASSSSSPSNDTNAVPSSSPAPQQNALAGSSSLAPQSPMPAVTAGSSGPLSEASTHSVMLASVGLALLAVVGSIMWWVWKAKDS
jgi:hypothetical protein